MLRRGLLLVVGASLLGLLAGCCHHCQGRCDCGVFPLEHGTPCPFTKSPPIAAPAAEPVAPVPAN